MTVSRRRPTVAVVGLGLIGGSLARALSRAGYAVIGVDRPEVARRARAARAVARTVARPEEAADMSDVLVLAAPPAVNLRLLRRVARRARPGLVITDVGSVKGPICREADRRGLAFVGGHPMAGTERSGFGASSAGLFRGRSWILCPGRRASRDAVAAVRRVARAVGARPVPMGPAEHDRTGPWLQSRGRSDVVEQGGASGAPPWTPARYFRSGEVNSPPLIERGRFAPPRGVNPAPLAVLAACTLA